MLILSNEEIESLLTLELALKSLERAYVSQAQGTAFNRPRSDLYLPGIREGSAYAFKTMEGGLTSRRSSQKMFGPCVAGGVVFAKAVAVKPRGKFYSHQIVSSSMKQVDDEISFLRSTIHFRLVFLP